MMALRADLDVPAARVEHARRRGPAAVLLQSNAAARRLTEVFEPHRDELTVEPRRRRPLLRTLVLGFRHPAPTRSRCSPPTRSPTSLLGGIRTRHADEGGLTC